MTRIRSQNRSIFKILLLAVLFGVIALFSACSTKEVEEEPYESSAISSEVVEEEEDTSVFAEGTSLSGQDISGKTVAEALEIGRSYLNSELEALEISVKFQNDTVQLKGAADFTYQDVLDLTLEEILESREPGDYEIQYVIDLSEAGETRLEEAAQACYSEVRNATVSEYNAETESFTFTEEATGVRVNLSQTLEDIQELLAQKHGGAVQAEFVEVAPTVTQAYLAENFTQISSYSTVSENTENGNSNMKLAFSHVNGTVLKPGEVFSYNTVIGDSTTTENGYLAAGGISGGVIVQMIGGGICQGSTTVYGAVIRAGLEIVERHNHGIKSTYCPIGQDAMVDYGSADFKFKNNYDTPIYIMSSMVDVTLYVSIYGVQPEEWDTIEIYSEQTATYDVLTTVSYKEDLSLSSGEYVLTSTGNQGSEAIASRSYYKNGELVKTEELPSSYYPPSGRVYTYGPGTDTTMIDTSVSKGNTSSGSTSVAAEATPTPQPAEQSESTPEPTPAPEESTSEEVPVTEEGTE